MLWVRTAIFLVVLPGTLFFYLPLWLARSATSFAPLGPLGFLGLPCLLVGSAALLWCMRDFVVRGRGTPAPIDPPRELVVRGLYRFVRNPMYVAGVVILLGHFLWSQAAILLAYTAVVFLVFHLFVVLYEEPALSRQFGEAYREYRARVPRWVPRLGAR